MYFSDFLRLLLRRWLVVLLGAVLTLAGGAYVAKKVPTQYEATGQLLLLLPPDASGITTPTNPYLNLQEGLTTTASLLASDAMTPDTVASMSAAGHRSTYSVAVVPGTGPLLTITADDVDPTKALATRDALVSYIDASLRTMQSQVHVPTRQLIFTRPASIARTAAPLHGSKLRALVATAAVGIGLTLVFAFAVDRLRSRRKKDEDRDGEPEAGAPSSKSLREASEPADERERSRTAPGRRRTAGVAARGASTATGRRLPDARSA